MRYVGTSRKGNLGKIVKCSPTKKQHSDSSSKVDALIPLVNSVLSLLMAYSSPSHRPTSVISSLDFGRSDILPLWLRVERGLQWCKTWEFRSYHWMVMLHAKLKQHIIRDWWQSLLELSFFLRLFPICSTQESVSSSPWAVVILAELGASPINSAIIHLSAIVDIDHLLGLL